MPSEKLEKVVMKPFKMDPTQNNSQQELVRDNPENERRMRDVTFREWIVVTILCFVNLINYMDRFTIAGVLDRVKQYFDIQNDEGGLLQTAFILSYMLFAPIFGYLGDRYNRRYIMAFGVFMWSITTLCGSYMTNFYWFVFFRALVGIGEASYSTIAPTIISDYFVGDIRSKMLAIFYFAIPVGSGLGYIIGSETADLFGQWQWALRVTPALGIAAVLLIVFILDDPERGQSEGSGHMEATPWIDDMKDIIRNRSFMLSTAGFTCVAFVAGALSWWGPLFIEKGLKLQSNGSAETAGVPYKFGVISMLSGLLGVPFGSYIAQKLRPRYNRIDANICAFGLLMSSPLVFLVCITARYNASLCFTLVFFAEFFFNLTWSIIADILLAVAIFGLIVGASGLIGLILGAYFSQILKEKVPAIDPIICGIGLIMSTPLFIWVISNADKYIVMCFVILFFGEILMNLNWAIVVDIGLYVVLPTRRSTAEGFQLLFSHALGDAGSPYLIGVLSETFKTILMSRSSSNSTTRNEEEIEFSSLQYALFTTCFVEVLGGIFFIITAFYIVQDKKQVDDAVHAGNSRQLLVNNQDNDPMIS